MGIEVFDGKPYLMLQDNERGGLTGSSWVSLCDLGGLRVEIVVASSALSAGACVQEEEAETAENGIKRRARRERGEAR